MRRTAILLPAALAVASLAGCSLFSAGRPTYNVGFADNASRIDDPARTTIVEAARVANAHPLDPVVLDGYADTKDMNVTGTRARELARLRVDAVAEALTGVGVNASRIVRAPYTVDPEASAGVASRRVEIDIGH